VSYPAKRSGFLFVAGSRHRGLLQVSHGRSRTCRDRTESHGDIAVGSMFDPPLRHDLCAEPRDMASV
jgi:hypothetical protein